MAIEAERKFLVNDDSWKNSVTNSMQMTQAYLCKDKERTVRIRISGDKAFLTIKGSAVKNTISVPEFEYPIPASDAQGLLRLCLPGRIIKTRHIVPCGGKNWEVDVFGENNAGLVMAEIELSSENEAFEKPDWLGAEVTFDARYKNAALSEKPFLKW